MLDTITVVVLPILEISTEDTQEVGLSNVDLTLDQSETEELIELIPKIEKILNNTDLVTN